jgi:hypothetical protein
MENKIYRQSLLINIMGMLVFSLVGVAIILIGVFCIEKAIKKYFIICGGIFVIAIMNSLLFFTRKKFAIIVNNKYIRMNYWDFKMQIITIKWEDIIGVYVVDEYTYAGGTKKIILVIPKAEIVNGEKICSKEYTNEEIDIAIKMRREEEWVREYLRFLAFKNKGIRIPRYMKNYRDLLKEICFRASNAVIDDKVKKEAKLL